MIGCYVRVSSKQDKKTDSQVRYVARAVPEAGWRVWGRKQKRWWGNPFSYFPKDLLTELNGSKRPEKLVALSKKK
jgi:hypothetical protein